MGNYCCQPDNTCIKAPATTHPGDHLVCFGSTQCIQDACELGACYLGPEDGGCDDNGGAGLLGLECESRGGTFLGKGTTCKTCGETCDDDSVCASGCCFKEDDLIFAGGGRRRQLSGTGQGQCTKSNWCRCADDFGGMTTPTFHQFLSCVEPCPLEPFDCKDAKPIDLLKLRWEGDAALLAVYGVNGKDCDTKDPWLFETTPVNVGGHIQFSAPSGVELDNDLTVCSESSGEPVSRFHISCSDPTLKDETACFQDQGDGKNRKKQRGLKKSSSGTSSGSRGGSRSGSGGEEGGELLNDWKLVRLEGEGEGKDGKKVILNCGDVMHM